MTNEPSDYSPALLPEQFSAIADLACIVHRLEAGAAPIDALQYQRAAISLGEALAAMPADDELCAIFLAYPCAIEVYENSHYAQAGLCLREPEEAQLGQQLTIELLNKLQCRA